MGGHYGSIHVRTEDVTGVRAAVEGLGHPRTRRFLIAPAIGGWVTVFPENHGQDQSVAEALAAKLAGESMIYCAVHDDDVFAFGIYEGGKLTESYNSCPDYFGEKNPPPRGGNAQALAKFAGKEKIPAIQALLDEEKYTFEVERLEKFGKLMGLPNIVAAYEYVRDGDVGRIQRKREFAHVPDLADEKKARKETAAKILAERKKLQSRGILLADIPSEKAERYFFKTGDWAVNPITPEVIVATCELESKEPEKTIWRKYAGPAWKEVELLHCPVGTPTKLQMSGTGRYLALGSWGHGSVWDLISGRKVVERTFPRNIQDLAFSPDEKWIYVIASNAPKTKLHRISMEGADAGSIDYEELHFETVEPHPSGDFLAVIDNGGILLVLEARTLEVVTQRWILDSGSLLLDRRFEGMAEDMNAKLMSLVPAARDAAYQRGMRRHFLPKDPIRTCCFDSNGSWIFFGTRNGLRCMKWDDVVSGAEMTQMKATLSVEGEMARHEGRGGRFVESRLTYAVVFDRERQRVLYSGLEGKISFVNLTDGSCGTLLSVPGKAALIKLAVSCDRSALIATAHEFNFKDNKQTPQRLQIWNYRALCERAGIQY